MNEFANAPKTIGELRASRAGTTAADWSPRDVLIDLLRDIDEGKITPENLIVVYMGPSNETPQTSQSVKSEFARVTLLSWSLFK